LKICIDPGHGGKDSGSVSKRPIILAEKDFNLLTSKYLAEMLADNGIDSVVTRTEDIYAPLASRVKYAKNENAELFVSIHANGCNDPKVHGIEVWYSDDDETENSKKLATIVLQSLMEDFREHKSRGIKPGNFAVLKGNMPSILIECEFLTNPFQAVFLAHNQFVIANAIGRGIFNYQHENK
jgi:N-acetylmuramoyl-L-alanine amidase